MHSFSWDMRWYMHLCICVIFIPTNCENLHYISCYKHNYYLLSQTMMRATNMCRRATWWTRKANRAPWRINSSLSDKAPPASIAVTIRFIYFLASFKDSSFNCKGITWNEPCYQSLAIFMFQESWNRYIFKSSFQFSEVAVESVLCSCIRLVSF